MTDYLDDDSFAEGAKVVSTPVARKPKTEDDEDSFAEGASVVSTPTAAASGDSFAEGAKVVAAPSAPVAARPPVPLYAGKPEGYEPRTPGFFEKPPVAATPVPIASHAATLSVPPPVMPQGLPKTGVSTFTPPRPAGMGPGQGIDLAATGRDVTAIPNEGVVSTPEWFIKHGAGAPAPNLTEASKAAIRATPKDVSAFVGKKVGEAVQTSSGGTQPLPEALGEIHPALGAVAGAVAKGADILSKQVERQNDAARQVARGVADRVLPGNTDAQGVAEGLADAAGMAADPRLTYGIAGLHALAPAAFAPYLDSAMKAGFGTLGAKDVAEGTAKSMIAKYVSGDPEDSREGMRQAAFGASLLVPIAGAEGLRRAAESANVSAEARQGPLIQNAKADLRRGFLSDIGLPETATHQEINQRVKQVVRETHPDVAEQTPATSARFQRAIATRDEFAAAPPTPESVQGVAVPPKNVPQRIFEAYDVLKSSIKSGNWGGASDALRVLREPGARAGAPPPEAKLPIGELGPAQEVNRDRVERQGVPGEERFGQEHVETGPVQGAGGEAAGTGGVVQGAQAGLAPEPGGHVPQEGDRAALAGLTPEQGKVQGEAPADMAAQVSALVSGARRAILWHPKGPQPIVAPPPGILQKNTPAGTIWWRKDSGLKGSEVVEMSKSVEGVGKLLEMPPGGRPEGENPGAVSVLDGDGNEVWSAEVSPETREAALGRAAKMADKVGGTVTEGTRHDVVAGRQERVAGGAERPVESFTSVEDLDKELAAAKAKAEKANAGSHSAEWFRVNQLSKRRMDLEIEKIPLGDRQQIRKLQAEEDTLRKQYPSGLPGNLAGEARKKWLDIYLKHYPEPPAAPEETEDSFAEGAKVVATPEAPAPEAKATAGPTAERIEAIVKAARRPALEIREKREIKGTDGNWHRGNGLPVGVSSTGDAARVYGYGYVTPDGVGVGQIQPTREAAEAAQNARLDKTDQEFRSTLQKMTPEELEKQHEYWITSKAKAAEAATAPLKPAKKTKAKKPPVAVDMNRQRVAYHLKLRNGNGWETDLLGLDRAAKEFEADGRGTRAQFWKDLASEPEVGGAPAPEPRATLATATRSETFEPKILGNTLRARAPRGTVVQLQNAVVPIESVVASHDTSLAANRNYPADLQPRDRTRAASEIQVNDILDKMEPSWLGESPKAGDGAPVIGEDGFVEGGNARKIALQRAYERQHPNAEKYREWLIENADALGVDAEDVRKIQHPLYARIRRTAVPDRAEWADELNARDNASMSVPEQAAADAKRLTPGLMELFYPSEDGDLMASTNRRFVAAFISDVIPKSEVGTYLDKQGNVSRAALERIRNAILSKTYDDTETVSMLSESLDVNIKNVGAGMLLAAPSLAQLKAGIAAGAAYPLDITPNIVEAAKLLSFLKSQGTPVEAYLRQQGLFGDVPVVTGKILTLLDEHKRSSKKIALLLKEYARIAEAAGDPREGDLLGMNRAPTIEEVLSAAEENLAETLGPEPETGDLFSQGRPKDGGGAAQEGGGSKKPDDQLAEEPTAYGQPAIAAPVFFSAVERTIDAIPFKSIPGPDLLARLAKTPGVKKEELEWLGLPQWLGGKDRVTKDEVKAFLDENKVEVKTVTLGGADQKVPKYLRDRLDKEDRAYADAAAQFREAAYANGLSQTQVINGTLGPAPEGISAETLALHYAVQKAWRKYSNTETQIQSFEREHNAPTKYENYTMPGGENYREVLLTKADPKLERLRARRDEVRKELEKIASLPSAEHAARGAELTARHDQLRSEHSDLIEKIAGSSDEAVRLLRERNKVMGQMTWFEVGTPEFNRLDDEFQILDKLLGEENDRTKGNRPRDFTSGHFNEPNILVHLRANDRTDALGKKVLFVEEVQSDWHEHGRKGGYAGPPVIVELFAVRPKGRPDGQQYATFGSRAEAEHYIETYDKTTQAFLDIYPYTVKRERSEAVPDAPFKKSWPLLAMKWAIRHAAENGYDRVAWTPGQVQAARYDLSKHIDKIEYEKSPDGTYIFQALQNGHTAHEEDGISIGRIEDLVGKEIARKIAANEGDLAYPHTTKTPTPESRRVLSNLMLKVGGEGMKGFYDKILPAEVNKYVKPWGAKVGETYLAAQGETKLLANDGEASGAAIGARPVHAVEITPAMRESVLAGQPLFEKKTTYDSRQKELFDDGNRDTLRKPGGAGENAAAPAGREGTLPVAPVQGAARGGLEFSQKSSRFTLGQLASRNREAQERGSKTMAAYIESLRATVPGGVGPDNDPLVITARKISKAFDRGEYVSLIGYEVPSAEAAGVVAQIAANPAYETWRIGLVDDDNVVVAEIPFSCHAPAGVRTNHPDISDKRVIALMKQYGATKHFMDHNHPGGDATPSDGDKDFTATRLTKVPGFMGHVVRDHNKFSVIQRDGHGGVTVTTHVLSEDAKALRPKLFEDPDETEAAKHLGAIVDGAVDFAKLGIAMHTNQRSVLLIFMNRIGDVPGKGGNRVRALSTVPFEKFLDTDWMTRRVRYEQGFHGAQHVLAYSSGEGLSPSERLELIDAARTLYGKKVEGGTTLSDFLLGNNPRNSFNYRGLKTEARTSQGFTDAAQPVRLAEKDTPYGIERPTAPRTEAFDRWFEGSKVVDENGDPKVMYHGTMSGQDFDTFWTKGGKVDLGAHFGTAEQASDIIDATEKRFSERGDSNFGNRYGVLSSDINKRVYPVYLSIKNPLRLPDLGGWWHPRSYVVHIPASARGDEGKLRKLAKETLAEINAGDVGRAEEFPDEVRQLLKDMGYDGVVYVNENEAVDEEADSYIAFRPEQVKSAIANKGTYSPEDPRIVNEEGPGYGAPPVREKGIPPDAPHIALSRDTAELQGDADYKEAKAGDREAAVRLVNRLVTPGAIERVKAFGRGVTYVFPHAEEATGRNAIPGMVSMKLAAETGGGVDEDIVQSNRVYHTGANAKQRIVSRPTFDGPVEKGGRYVLVDDVTTFGGTLAELADHIQRNGGEVAGTFLLADKTRGGTLRPEGRRTNELEKRLGDEIRSSLGIDPSALTGPEADYLIGFKSPEQLRTTVATARQERADRLRAKGVREGEISDAGSPYGKKSALDYASRFAPGAARALKPRGPEDEIRLAATDPTAGIFSEIFASRAPKASKTSQLPSPLDAHSPEVERRMRAAEGIVSPSIIDRVKKAAVDLEHSFTRHFIDLDSKESPTLGLDVDILRQLEAAPEFAKQVALDTLSYISDGLDKPAARLFTRILALRDLQRSVEEGLYEGRDELPFGYEDLGDVSYDLRKYEAMAKNDEAVATALVKREKYAGELTQKLVDMEFLPKESLDDPRYYHRQVMAFFNLKEAAYVGTGSQDVRVHKKGFQKARSGGGDFNLRYQEAEFEWMAQAHSLIAMREAIDRLGEANDIKPGLDQQAKWQNTIAVYGGIENYNEVQRIKGEIAAIFMGGDIVLDSEDRKRVAGLNQKLDEMDPLRPFGQRIAWNIHDLKKKAEHGELDHVDKWFQEAVDQLAESSEFEEYRGEEDTPNLFFPLLNHLLEKGKAGSLEAAGIFKAIAERKKFIKQELGKEFKTWEDLVPEAHPLAPKSRAVVWQPEKGSAFYKAATLPERALDRFVEEMKSGEGDVDRESVEKLLEKAHSGLVMGGPKTQWVIPEGLAKTLDNWRGGIHDRGMQDLHAQLIKSWKQWILLSPPRALVYNLNNMSGDVDIVIASYPRALGGWWRAAKDLWKYSVKEDKSDQNLVAEMQRAMKLGVISSGLTMQEIPDINEIGAFQGLTSDDPNIVQKVLQTYWTGVKKFSTWRENTLRLAVFRYLENELKKGKALYGTSKRHEVDAVRNAGDGAAEGSLAAKLTRELIGDYGNISVAGKHIRERVEPFYSWLEINAARYVQLLRNAAHEGGGTGGGARAGRAAAIGAKKIIVNYAKLALFAPLLYGAIQAWNNTMFPEEEKLLGSDRKRLHLILGRNADGSIRTMRFQGALSDALDWFGAGNAVADVKDLTEGRRTVRNKVNDAITSPIDKIVGGWEPFSKTLFELVFGAKSYPSLFKEGTLQIAPSKIRDRAEYAGDVAWPIGALYRKVTGKPKRPTPDMGIPGAGPLLSALLVQRTDPGEAAYWYSRNLAGKWLEDQGVSHSTGGPTGDMKDRADALYYFKKACEWGDDPAAAKWLVEYYKMGGTPQKMNESFVREHPLGGLPLGKRGAFLNSLPDKDKAIVQDAVGWYEKGRERGRGVASGTLFTPAPRRAVMP